MSVIPFTVHDFCDFDALDVVVEAEKADPSVGYQGYFEVLSVSVPNGADIWPDIRDKETEGKLYKLFCKHVKEGKENDY